MAIAGTVAASIAMTLSLAPDPEASGDRVVEPQEEEEIAFGMPANVVEDPYVARTLLGGDGLDPKVYEPRIEPPEVRALHEIPPPEWTR